MIRALLLVVLAHGPHWPIAPASLTGSVVGDITFDGFDLFMFDDDKICLGDNCEYWFVYNNTGTQWELWGTDVAGPGTDGVVASVDDGDDIFDFTDGITTGGVAALNAGANVSGANLDVVGQMITEGDGTYAPGHSPTGIYTEGSVEIDGACYVDGAVVADGDLIYNSTPGTDVDPDDMLIHSAYNYSQGSQTASNLILGGGLAEKYFLINSFATGALDSVAITACRCEAGVCLCAPANTRTEGANWTAAVDDATTACTIYDTYTAVTPPGVSIGRTDATCSDGKVFVTPLEYGYGVFLTVTDAGGGGAVGTATNGTDGQVLMPPGSAAAPGVAFLRGPTTGIYEGAAGQIWFARGGVQHSRIFGNAYQLLGGATGYIDLAGGYINDSTTGTELRFPADGQMQQCIAAETACFTHGASAANVDTLFDKAGTGPAMSRSFPYTLTIAEAGGGAHATATLTPTSNTVLCDCDDAQGCTVTMGETGMVTGMRITIVGETATHCDFADTDGVSNLTGAFEMSDDDTLELVYSVDEWVEASRSDN